MAIFNGDEAVKHDPDYFMSWEADAEQQNVFEKNSRSSAIKKISDIIETEFSREIESKKKEVIDIYKTLNKATKMMHYLRFAIVSDYYNKDSLFIEGSKQKQTRPHNTVNAPRRKVPFEERDPNECLPRLGILNGEIVKLDEIEKKEAEQKTQHKSAQETIVNPPPIIYTNCRTRRKIIIGNLSKWVESELRDNMYKWTIYVKDSEKCDLGLFVSKVRFFLHSSYKPHDIVELTSSPFHLTRFGWGEFPVRVQLHFANDFDKPIDIIHKLQLDPNRLGLQTLAKETEVDIWVTMKKSSAVSHIETESTENISNCDFNNKESAIPLIIKKENDTSEEVNVTILHSFPTDHDYICTSSKYDKELNEESSQFSDYQVSKIDQTNEQIMETKNLCNNFQSEESSVNLSNTISSKVFLEKEFKVPNHNNVNNISESECSNSLQRLSSNNTVISNKKVSSKYDKIIIKKYSYNAIRGIINKMKSNNTFNLLKLIATKTPMITENAKNVQYKMIHPYATENYIIYSNYSIAKQRALEHKRAICVFEILSETKYKNICSIRDFIVWARKYGYTPILYSKDMQKIRNKGKSINVDVENENYELSSTAIDEVYQWLMDADKIKRNPVNNSDEDEEIEVTNDLPDSDKSLSKDQNQNQKHNPTILLEYPEDLQNNLHEYVRNTADARGIKLMPEEIVPGVLHSSASVLITKAVECLIDDLLRLSCSTALDKCKNQRDEIVIVNFDDVRTALLKKDEFEIFTNAGLGSDE